MSSLAEIIGQNITTFIGCDVYNVYDQVKIIRGYGNEHIYTTTIHIGIYSTFDQAYSKSKQYINDNLAPHFKTKIQLNKKERNNLIKLYKCMYSCGNSRDEEHIIYIKKQSIEF